MEMPREPWEGFCLWFGTRLTKWGLIRGGFEKVRSDPGLDGEDRCKKPFALSHSAGLSKLSINSAEHNFNHRRSESSD